MNCTCNKETSSPCPIQEGHDWERFEILREQYHRSKITPEELDKELEQMFGPRAAALISNIIWHHAQERC